MRPLIVLTASALLAVGCGGSTSTGPDSTAASTADGVPALTDQQAPPERVIIEVIIKDGQVTPTNQQVQAAIDQPIVVKVNSDAADELHVHSNPEHTFEVKPAALQSFQFTVQVPGKVDVELHEAHRVVATITVQ